MLESIRRLFASRPEANPFTEVETWATGEGHGFKRARGDEGFVVDGQLDGMPWRIEWGPPQRDYIHGRELRLRIELTLRADTQMLLMSRSLMDTLERATFEEFTDNVQTQIGSKTPEEMRWLVMLPKIDLAAMKELRGEFGAVANLPAVGRAWIEGPLAKVLADASTGLLRHTPPFVLITLRGRAYLRMQLRSPEVSDIAAALTLFEVAIEQAVRAAGASTDKSTEWGNSATSAWQSLKPDDGSRPKPRAVTAAQPPRMSAAGQAQLYLPSSSFAIALRCTSSGPSA